MRGVPRGARLGESADADPAGGEAGLSRVPRESSGDPQHQLGAGSRATVLPRSAVGPIPKLYGLSSEDPRELRGQESSKMKFLLVILFMAALTAQTPSP